MSGISGMTNGTTPDRNAAGQWDSCVSIHINGIVGQQYGGTEKTKHSEQYYYKAGFHDNNLLFALSTCRV